MTEKEQKKPQTASEMAAEQLQAAITVLTSAVNAQLNTIRALENQCERLAALLAAKTDAVDPEDTMP